MLDIILDTLIDAAKILPFLFLTYLALEFLEHRAGDRTLELINRSGRLGPVIGGALGIIPQCGFSAATSNLYAGGLITRGTMIAVFLSTSDEMLPILISRQVEIGIILKILAVKLIAAIIAGTAVDLVSSMFGGRHRSEIRDLCDDSDCKCDEEGAGIFLPALRHTIKIMVFIIIVSFALNVAVELIGEDRLSGFILNMPVAGELLAGVVGLIPNCAVSIVITELYLQGGMSAGAMLSGLLVGAGVGVLVLFRMNRNLKDNLKTLAVLYVSGVVLGMIAGALNIL